MAVLVVSLVLLGLIIGICIGSVILDGRGRLSLGIRKLLSRVRSRSSVDTPETTPPGAPTLCILETESLYPDDFDTFISNVPGLKAYRVRKSHETLTDLLQDGLFSHRSAVSVEAQKIKCDAEFVEGIRSHLDSCDVEMKTRKSSRRASGS